MKKVTTLRKVIKTAKSQNKGALKIRFALAKTALTWVNKKFHRATLKVKAKRILKIQKKIVAANDPKIKMYLKAQLRFAKYFRVLREKLLKATPHFKRLPSEKH